MFVLRTQRTVKLGLHCTHTGMNQAGDGTFTQINLAQTSNLVEIYYLLVTALRTSNISISWELPERVFNAFVGSSESIESPRRERHQHQELSGILYEYSGRGDLSITETPESIFRYSWQDHS